MPDHRLQVAPDALGAWLLAAPCGAGLLFGASAAAARHALAAAEPPPDRRLGVVFGLAVTGHMAAQATAALADAALAAFPYWYGSDRLVGLGANVLETAVLEGHLRALREVFPDLSPRWARRAVARAIAGRRPLDAEASPAAGLRQLVLALNGGPVTLIPALTRQPDALEAPALMIGLAWLARSSGSTVVALVPGAPGSVSLDRLACAELAGRDVMAGEDPPGAWVGPIEGRPHWASAAEQRLAAALLADRELATLFAFNQTVQTERGGNPRVDLLWRAGRLVVEIDGYADHSGREAFRRDRHRDYALAISGYLVVRLTAEEVLSDTALALDKLRDAVRFRGLNRVREPP